MSREEQQQGQFSNAKIPPDIIESTLPFISSDDIRNLSLTNRYFHKLLSFDNSDTLWHELFHKEFGTLNTNDEPFRSRNSEEFKTCSETILICNEPELTWKQRYHLRSSNAHMYTWGCLKHARLGYTASSNDNLKEGDINYVGRSLSFGVNYPTRVPWFAKDENNIFDNNCILQVSGGGFSFQILTKSGKLFSTGSTFTGGHKGPCPVGRAHDYNPTREVIQNLENSLPRVRIGHGTPINMTGVSPYNRIHNYGPTPTPTAGPHRDIYQEIQNVEKQATQFVEGNSQIRRMFTRNSFSFYNGEADYNNYNLELNRFVAVSSGRSHFLALDDKNNIYSWDSPESEHGVLIQFDNLPPAETNPFLKISCGWDFNCVYMYGVGLVLWKSRSAVPKGGQYSQADYKVVPKTGDLCGDAKVMDFACTQDCCVFYVTNGGDKLCQYRDGMTTAVDIPIDGTILKITSCFSLLVVFSTTGCYTIKITGGSLEPDSLTLVEIDDPDDRIISLAAGDYHNIALTVKGQIYSWGLESQLCGCLGLGPAETIVEQERVGNWENQRNVRVHKPTRVKIKENQICVAVAAGGWQTAALIIDR